MQEKDTNKLGQQPEDDNISVDNNGSGNIFTLILCVVIMALIVLIAIITIPSDKDGENSLSQSTDDTTSFIEEVEYTHSMKVYFFSEELGKEFIASPDILNNKMVAKMVETYLFAGNFDKEYYVFGDIKQQENLKKIYFDDPVGGKIGLMKDGWNVTFNYKLLKFLCDGITLREYLDDSYQNDETEKIEEATDMFIACVPGYPAFVHFKNKEQVYYMTLEYNGYISSKDYKVFKREEFLDTFDTQNVDVVINGRDGNIVNNIATVNKSGEYEIDIVALLDIIFDDEHIYHNVGKTSLFVTDKKTGEKHLYVFINTQRLFFNVKPHYTDKGLPTDNWKPENENSQYDFRQGKLYLNESAAKEFLSLFGISMDIGDTINITYDEQSNCFTSYK